MNSSKQLCGFIMGLFSVIIPFGGSFIGLFNSMGMMLVSLCISFVLGLIGLILSASSASGARAGGYSKGMSIAGIILSVIGMVMSIGMGIVMGGLFLLIDSLVN